MTLKPDLTPSPTRNSGLPVESSIPHARASLFSSHPEAAMYVGLLASGSNVILSSEMVAAGRLRANVYINECLFLPPSARLNDGTERDEDDDRSDHFGVIENLENLARMVGTLRAIMKRDEDDCLPVELAFPEAFDASPAPVGSVEASRFIARHEDRRGTQRSIALALIRAVIVQSVIGNRQPIYAIAEESLCLFFARSGIPLTRLSNKKPLEQYHNTENMALRFDPAEIIAATTADLESKRLITPYFRTARQNGGVGYYDRMLLTPSTEASS